MCNNVCVCINDFEIKIRNDYTIKYTIYIITMCEPFTYALIIRQPYTFGVPWRSV